MLITLNGQNKPVADGTTLTGLASQTGHPPERLVAELNKTIIAREQWPHITLKEGDSVELLTFVGGG